MSRFLRTANASDSSSSSESESEDEDESDDDKRLEEMEATGKAMDNALKINDWIAISSGRLIHILLYAAHRSHVWSSYRV